MKHQRMPVLFIGHGSPMNAIADNAFTRRLHSLAREVEKPRAVLCVSAHWMTEGSWITHMAHPKTIHDFYGFPQALFDVRYPSPGAPEIAEEIQSLITHPSIHLDDEMWGLDHGAWSVLRHMYPDADVPVMQLSLYLEQPPEYHMKLGQELRGLRDRGVLIVASGNVVHNLREIRWEPDALPFDWAMEFDEWVKEKLSKKDFMALAHDYGKTPAGKLSVPTTEHYYPLLYAIGSAVPEDQVRFEFEEIQNGSISMRCVSFGKS